MFVMSIIKAAMIWLFKHATIHVHWNLKSVNFHYHSQLIEHRCPILHFSKNKMHNKVQGSLLKDEVDEGAFMCGNIAGRVVDTCKRESFFLIFGLDQRRFFPCKLVL